jgi:hypothetical protein
MPLARLTDADLRDLTARHPNATILKIHRNTGEVVFEDAGQRWVFAVDTFAGERSASCFEVTDLTDRDGNWTARDWSWDEQAQDQQESVGF